MKRLLTLAMVVFAAGALRADLLYFMANAYTGEAPNFFDYAMVGVRSVEDGKDVGYLKLKSSYDASETADILLTDNEDRYHATGWADFGEYATEDYVFYVAGFTFDGETPLFDTGKTMSYSDLLYANHVYVPGETNPQDVTMWVVPEPTSGLLFLLGLASLALRRKKGFEV